MSSLRFSFYVGATLAAIAAIFSALRGPRYVDESDEFRTTGHVVIETTAPPVPEDKKEGEGR
jgi:hypothetical protein